MSLTTSVSVTACNWNKTDTRIYPHSMQDELIVNLVAKDIEDKKLKLVTSETNVDDANWKLSLLIDKYLLDKYLLIPENPYPTWQLSWLPKKEIENNIKGDYKSPKISYLSLITHKDKWDTEDIISKAECNYSITIETNHYLVN